MPAFGSQVLERTITRSPDQLLPDPYDTPVPKRFDLTHMGATAATPAIIDTGSGIIETEPGTTDVSQFGLPKPAPKPVVTIGASTLDWAQVIKIFDVMRADTIRELRPNRIDPKKAILPTDDEHIAKVVQACVNKLKLKNPGQAVTVTRNSVAGTTRNNQTDGQTFAIHQDAVAVIALNGTSSARFHEIRNCCEEQEMEDVAAVIGHAGCKVRW